MMPFLKLDVVVMIRIWARLHRLDRYRFQRTTIAGGVTFFPHNLKASQFEFSPPSKLVK